MSSLLFWLHCRCNPLVPRFQHALHQETPKLFNMYFIKLRLWDGARQVYRGIREYRVQ